MKITVEYGSRFFGNDDDAKGFDVNLERWDGLHGPIDVRFQFDERAWGRGLNPLNVGLVRGGSFSLSAAQARRLGAKLLEYADSRREKPLKLKFGGGRKSTTTMIDLARSR
jgi:hypothetical protein